MFNMKTKKNQQQKKPRKYLQTVMLQSTQLL